MKNEKTKKTFGVSSQNTYTGPRPSLPTVWAVRLCGVSDPADLKLMF